MSAVPMCPGCRAILDADAAKCPYCGWEIARTRVRREGGFVERHCAPVGGVGGALALAIVLLFVLTSAVDVRLRPRILEEHGAPVPDQGGLLVSALLGPTVLTVCTLGGCEPTTVLEGGEAWRLLSAVFLHYGLIHLVLNMGALLYLAPFAAEAWGGGKALGIYLLGGLAASAADVGWHVIAPELGIADPGGVGAGASGALCAWAGALGAIGLRAGGRRGREWWMEMVKPVLVILVLGILLEFTGGAFALGNAAHLGGLAAGTAMGLTLSFGIRSRGDPASVRAWDFISIALALATAASFVPGFVALARGE